MTTQSLPHLLLFGASGAIGGGIAAEFVRQGWQITAVARNQLVEQRASALRWLAYDPFAADSDAAAFDTATPYDAVCWAQGANHNDSAYSVTAEAHLDLYRANALYNVLTLQILLARKLLAKPARLCVISSVWQTVARTNKLSYCMSKAALQGFVLAAAADLAAEGHLINAVLPGALDTAMTRNNLNPDQLRRIEQATPFERLPLVDDVAALAHFLCSAANRSITGQFIAADLGFRHVRVL